MRKNKFLLNLFFVKIVIFSLSYSLNVFSANYIWIEGEDFKAIYSLKKEGGVENLPGGSNGYKIEGWGNASVMSAGKVLHINLSSADVEKYLSEKGLLFSKEFEIEEDGEYEIWIRIGYEFVRSKFYWQIDSNEWILVSPDEATINIQPIQTWNELAWLKVSLCNFKRGKHTISFLHKAEQKNENGKLKTERILHMLDCVCISKKGGFIPFGKFKPDEDYKNEKDISAEKNVFRVNLNCAEDGRAWTELNGFWLYTPYEETEFPIKEEERLKPMLKLPDLTKFRWLAYKSPLSREEQMPEQIFAHRYLLKCILDFPDGIEEKGVFLDVQRSNFIISVFLNGKFVGWTDTFHTAWQMDLTKFVKSGRNELIFCVKDAYYSLNPKDDDSARILGNRRYWNLPLEFLESNQGIAAKHDYPLASDCRSGLLEPVSIVVCGKPYISDVFIKPLEGKLSIDITIFNPTDEDQKISLLNEVIPYKDSKNSSPELSFKKVDVDLKAGENKTFTIEENWTNPKRWWPDNPFLYFLQSKLMKNDKVVDTKNTRFGFRTIDWSGEQFKINGVKWQMWADCNIGDSPQDFIELSKKSNMNQFRYWRKGGWGNLTRRQVLNLFDEKGILVRSSGTFDGQLANYGGGLREKDPSGNLVAKKRLWDAWRKQMTAWIKEERNHPSVYIWSVENEITYINVNNLGQWRECEPEVAEGVRHVMRLDPTRPAMIDGGNCLRDESLPINGAHYIEFMNASWRDFPDAAYTKEHLYDKSRPQRGAWPIVRGRPIMAGEIYFAEGYTNADFATIGGEKCFIGIGETMDARGLWAKMLSEGYRWCEYGSFHFWLGNSSRTYWKSWSPIALFCKQWNWTFGSGQKVSRTLKLFNNTSDKTPIDAEYSLQIAGKEIETKRNTFNLQPGESVEFNIDFKIPLLDLPSEGKFYLKAYRNGKEVFSDEKKIRILCPEKIPTQSLEKVAISIYDPNGQIIDFLKSKKIPCEPLKNLNAIPEKANIILIGGNAITPEMKDSKIFTELAASSKKVIILDQEIPISPQALGSDMESTNFCGRIGFSEDISHPIFNGLTQDDFFTWGNNHILYKNAYKKGTKGGKSLLQCDTGLSCTALFESQINDGLLIVSQLDISAKIASEAVAQQIFLNLLNYAATYTPIRLKTLVLLPENDNRLKVLEKIGLEFEYINSLSDSLIDKPAIIIADANNKNISDFLSRKNKLDSFCKNGGWLVLWGITPESLPGFNKLIGHQHLIRKFLQERVILNYPTDKLASGLTLRDVVMDTGKQMYGWMALKEPAGDIFTYVVDHTDIAPFCKFPDGIEMGKSEPHPGKDHEPLNMVNGFTSDDNWVFTYTTIIDKGHKTKFTLHLPKEEEIIAFRIRPSKLYHPITKIKLYFDDDPEPFTAVIPIREQPITEDIQITPTKKAKKITIEIAEWAKRGEHNIVVIDNLWLIVKRPEEYLKKTSSILNIGGLMVYHNEKGGIFLNQLYIPDSEQNPENADKKANIVKTILSNMGAVFKKDDISTSSSLEFSPIIIPDSFFNTYRDQKGKPSWFKGGDIASIPSGNIKVRNVNFHISNLSTSPVPSVFTLAGEGSHVKDKEIKGIPLNTTAKVLAFLHTYNEGSELKKMRNSKQNKSIHIFSYFINYEDGTKNEVKV
ncbi:MAG TPA: glycoside hydrolase family 2 TIM barrel-domain containing protein, partial [Victivallales bacterium]|nr:glycoside hydrolase family 2 TIM barrel-domain containing protein [Victivallales bacterium]